jgi:hypothetical protein
VSYVNAPRPACPVKFGEPDFLDPPAYKLLVGFAHLVASLPVSRDWRVDVNEEQTSAI